MNQIFYISRKPAEDFLTALDKAFKEEPDKHPILFHVYGIGGIGKSTLLDKVQETHQQQGHIAKFDFSGKIPANETPLKVMVKLYDQLPKPDIWKRELFKSDPFIRLYKQYDQTLQRLETEPIEGKQAVEDDQRNLVKELGSAAVYGLGALFLTPIEPVSGMSLGMNAIAEATKGTVTGVGAIKDRLLLKHPATKQDNQLQQLMLKPIPQLTKAFVEGLIRLQKPYEGFIPLPKEQKPIILILDHYEKVTSDFALWLSEYLLKEKELQLHPIRLVIAGRYSLRKKFPRNRDLIFERQLDKFDQRQTEAYLKEIGITDPKKIREISKATDGFPFHLDLIRQQKEEGREINCSRDNRELVDRLLEGLNPIQQQVVQLAAYCRWFDEALIQKLMEANGIDFQTAVDANVNSFEWLIGREFVSEEDYFRLNDVARDVLRRSQCKANQKKFRETHALLAKYFQRLANGEVNAEQAAPTRYENSKWREYTAESIYHALFANRDEGQHQLLTHFFAGAYLKQMDVVTAPFAAVMAEAEIEDYELLPNDTRKFLTNINLAIGFGSFVLDKAPEQYEFKDEQGNSLENSLKSQIEAALKNCLNSVDSLDGLGKYAGLLYKSLRCRTLAERADLLLRAKEQAEQIASSTHSEFSSSLFFNVGNGLYQLGRYEEAIASHEKAIEFKPDYHVAWNNRGAALGNLERSEEAIASYDKALEVKSDSYEAWNNRGNALNGLGRFEEAIASYDKAIEFKPDFHDAWNNRGVTLDDLGRFEEAIASYDKALEFKPDDHEAWYNRGNPLGNLERFEEAIASYDKAIELKPDYHQAWYNRGHALGNLERFEEAIASFDKAIEVKPDYHQAWSMRGLASSRIGRYDEALANHNEALKLQPKEPLLWTNQGIVLARSGRYEDALASCDKALELQANDESGFYGKACCYALQGDVDLAVENLQQAINRNPSRCRREAKRNSDFDSIRGDERFQALLQGQTN
jgi:tetratricopeptide (TPR) repeat protein